MKTEHRPAAPRRPFRRLAAVAAVVAALWSLPIVVLAILAPLRWRGMMLPLEGAEDTQDPFWRALEHLRLPPDTSITPAAAGRTLVDLAPPWRSRPEDSLGRRPRPAADTFHVLMKGLTSPGQPAAWVSPTFAATVTDRLADPRTKYLLDRIAILARAPGVDYLAALTDSLERQQALASPWVADPNVGTLGVAVQLLGLAAVADARAGRYDAALERLRTGISVALVLRASERASHLAGGATAYVPDFLRAMGRTYDLAQRPQPEWLVTALDGVNRLYYGVDFKNPSPAPASLAEARERLVSTMLDANLSPGTRWGRLLAVNRLECTTAAELVLGLRAATRRDRAAAERALVVTRSDSTFLGAHRIRRRPGPIRGITLTRGQRAEAWLGRAATRLTGNPRFEHCSAMWTTGVAFNQALERQRAERAIAAKQLEALIASRKRQ
ncbi:MAG: hypothetical protein AB7L66_09005 [Gemmatimonadales bacterium]